MTTERDLIQRLADALDHYRQLLTDDRREVRALAAEARAYLDTTPEPAAGPTDEELLELMPETMRDGFAYTATVCSDATGGHLKPGIFRVVLNTAALEYARAVLARWGSSYPRQKWMAGRRSSRGAALAAAGPADRMPCLIRRAQCTK